MIPRFFSARRLGCLAAPLILGVVLGVAGFGWQLYQTERAQREFIETTCTVLDKRLEEITKSLPHTSRRHGGRHRSSITYHPLIQIRYDAAGSMYEIWTYSLFNVATGDRQKQQAIVDAYEIGKQYPCWYDPESPGRAVLKIQSSGHWIFLLFGLLFGIAATGFIGFAMAVFDFVRSRLRQ